VVSSTVADFIIMWTKLIFLIHSALILAATGIFVLVSGPGENSAEYNLKLGNTATYKFSYVDPGSRPTGGRTTRGRPAVYRLCALLT